MKPAIFIIFGITGDLARRKVLPAIYNLAEQGLLPEDCHIVGTSRRDMDTATLTEEFAKAIENANGQAANPAVIEKFGLSMITVNPANNGDYLALKNHLDSLPPAQRLFYLSIPPEVYGQVVNGLGEQGLNQGPDAVRLLVEKPFGTDLTSARELIERTAQHFSEDQIMRIDHYLAKETAQNILTFRAQNPLFNRIWNYRHITGVTITATETIGIEGRVGFYEHVGALRDLIQSHLLQLLALTLLDLPSNMQSDEVHAAKLRLLKSLLPANATDAIRGQYDTYRQEVDNDLSSTETYAALTLYSQDGDWQGVPLRLITGKAMAKKHTEICVHFGAGNELQFRLQPDEGIRLTLHVKKPGLLQKEPVETTNMDFTYEHAFSGVGNPDAYERVLLDAMRGDHLLFATDQEILASWEILQPVLDAWQHSSDDLIIYPSGSVAPTRDA